MYVLSSFQRTGHDPREASGPGSSLRPFRQARSPRFRPSRSIFGEPSKLIKTSRLVSSDFLRPGHFCLAAHSGCQPASSPPSLECPRQAALRATASASRNWSCFPCSPTWEPGTGPAWGRTPKANLDITRRGWACQPLSVDPLQASARGLSNDPLRRPRTPARFRGSLPHIRQANVHATHPA